LTEKSANAAKHFDVVLFRVNGVLFAAELGQVAGVFGVEPNSPANANAVRLDELFFGQSSRSAENWKLIKLKEKNLDGREWGILAEEPEDIAALSIEDIRPLPHVVEKIRTIKALWGSFIYGDEIGLLLNLSELCSDMKKRRVAA
jgi:hypothetical protein